MGPKLLLLFIVGDVLGAGVYAVTGDIAAQVGGIAWLPFVVAFAVVAPVAPVAMVLSAGRPLDAPSRTLSAARGRAELTASFPTWRPKPMPKPPGAPSCPVLAERLMADPRAPATR